MLARGFEAMMLFAACAAVPALAQEPVGNTDETKAWAEEAAALALAEAKSFDIRLKTADGETLTLIEKPLLRWSNTYDAAVFGSIYVWTHQGRPAAISSIFKFFTARRSFNAELHSLASEPLIATKQERIAWQPLNAGVQFQKLALAPAPAKTSAARLTQMRQIARDFSADVTTVIGKTKHELRLMPQPLMRYEQAGAVLDGALFAFARATDPDVILLLEAAGTGDELHWQYALARMHVGALSARYREAEVWSVEEMQQPYSRASGVYTLLQDLPEPKLP
jgi:hypothetical protein